MRRPRLFGGPTRSDRLGRLACGIVIPSFVVGAVLWLAGAVEVSWGIMAVASAIGCALLVIAVLFDRPAP